MAIFSGTNYLGKIAVSLGMGMILSMSVGTGRAIAESSPELQLGWESDQRAEFAQFPSDRVRRAVNQNVMNLLLNDGRFSTLATVLRLTGLMDVLRQEGVFTILAPTDEAFSRLPRTVLENLLKGNNIEQLIRIMRYDGDDSDAITSEELIYRYLATQENLSIPVEVGSETITVEGSHSMDADIQTENALIHVIEQLIILTK
ncbi:beta-Ig-H3/fasciclin [Limnospira maxima CS-328]|uniref:Beta-Ig-H3/fasciclin n=1 Tax=Limnospira maxima CS-328 TaxID=513049 RepID=B5W9P7_LIMMA|nr:fasciclin domain-containing protein [Limnospira maxima]EDZ91754.1 beta-Ig-H3/fasciclin [Limnospira maxima CS-328]MDC0839183.1 fasciclin domain-containing protein [Limnoraphis robusta]